MKLEFIIPIAPVPWSRARSNRRTGAYFHAKPYARFHSELRQYMRTAYLGDALDVPMRVSISLFVKVPKRRSFGSHCATGFDSDNGAKGVLDSLQGILWVNDSRITELNVKKLYDLTGGSPRIELTLETIEWKK